MNKLKKNEYQCENCKGIFTKAWSDEEASEEASSLWGEELLENNPAVVCDDCFNVMVGITSPKEFVEDHLRKN